MTSAAPAIAPEGIVDIIARIAPFTFNNGMDASMGVEFSDHGESIRFALEVTDLDQLNGGLEDFMAAVRANQEDLAERLSAGRYMARLVGEELNIDPSGLSTAASSLGVRTRSATSGATWLSSPRSWRRYACGRSALARWRLRRWSPRRRWPGRG